ncbi:MAG: helix-turn-helix domain-containing protein [Lachnospiraceae bacterium]|jgi:carbohydrate diacid regulator|nr:helix-turn-helix domain-containing protein [Lachnospiraceae bacterium]MBR1848742.1 helix-turn-helix domain-containing protein [Lachnospiraceae bacterium]
MISNQIILQSITELKTITKVDIGVFELNGSTVAATFETEDMDASIISDFASSQAESQVIGEHHFLKVLDDEDEVHYILDARALSEDAYMVGRIGASHIKELMKAYKERFDRNNFFQNLILDNLLLVDIYNRAKKLHITEMQPRVAFLVETENNDANVEELMRSLFTVQNGDFITSVEEGRIILIKAVEENVTNKELKRIANTIVDTINTELLENVRVAYGAVVHDLKDVSKSYKEATMAVEVGKIFYVEKKVVAYSSLGIGRLIYQLPISLCKLYIQEIFGDHIPEELDEETLNTVDKFFENNLNVSETSRQLFIHRNTLVYRIEKLQKATGLDIRTFDDALTLKIALMVVNYMNYLNEKQDF